MDSEDSQLLCSPLHNHVKLSSLQFIARAPQPHSSLKKNLQCKAGVAGSLFRCTTAGASPLTSVKVPFLLVDLVISRLYQNIANLSSETQIYPRNKFALQGKLDVCKILVYFKMGAAWEETDQGERMRVGRKFKILSQAKRSDLQY